MGFATHVLACKSRQQSLSAWQFDPPLQKRSGALAYTAFSILYDVEQELCPLLADGFVEYRSGVIWVRGLTPPGMIKDFMSIVWGDFYLLLRERGRCGMVGAYGVFAQ